MKHPIPRAALDDRLGFIGTSGSGKTYNAGTAIELLLASKARVVIIDPLGVWWGLRLLADGKKQSGFNVVIFGGKHADLPSNEQAGTLIGETAATMAESCILDLSMMPSRSAERRFMSAFLETIYRKAGGEPFHLVVDEADLFAPQNPQKGDEALLGHMDNIVRRGRVKGFIPWLISQRPAVLNKNVLSQVDGLLAFKLTASQDRDALDAWIEGQADKAQGKAIKDALPTFQVGEGVVWLPGHGILDRRPFPPKVTFDSSKKPKRGEKVKSKKLKPLDVGKLQAQLATVVEEAKANDPKELRRRVADLEAQLRKVKTPAPAPAPAALKTPVSRREDLATITALRKALEAAMKFIVEINASNFFKAGGEAIDKATIEKAIADATAHAVKMIEAQLERRNKELERLRREGQSVIGRLKSLLDQDVNVKVDVKHNEPVTISAPVAKGPVAGKVQMTTGDGRLTNPQAHLLRALAWWLAMGHPQPTRAQLAAIAGWKVGGSNMRGRLAELSTAGLLHYPSSGTIALTEAGQAAAPAPDTSTSLIDSIKAMLTNPQLLLFNALLKYGDEAISREQVATDVGWEASGSNMRGRLAELSSLELISYPVKGQVALQDWVVA